jgi:hypothetical protein
VKGRRSALAFALLAAAGCGATREAARAAAEDRDALRALVDGFHREDFRRDTQCVRFSPSGKFVAVVTPTVAGHTGDDDGYAEYTLRVWPCRDGRVARAAGDAPLFEQSGRKFLDRAPQWSHAGDRLAFTLREMPVLRQPIVGSSARLLVWTQEAGVREVGVLHESSNDIVVSSPCWSTRDRSIALAAGSKGPIDLHLYEVDSGAVVTRRIDDGPQEAPRATWSPDGRWIAIATRRSVFVHDVDAAATRRLFDQPEWMSSNAWIDPQWDGTGEHVGVVLVHAMTIDLPQGNVHEWKSDGFVQAVTWIPGGSHWYAVSDREGPENVFERTSRVLRSMCSEPPYTYSGCVVDGDGRVAETVFSTKLGRPYSMFESANEEWWFALPWIEATLLRTIR